MQITPIVLFFLIGCKELEFSKSNKELLFTD